MDALKSFLQIIVSIIAVIWSVFKSPILYTAGKITSLSARLFAWYKLLWFKVTYDKYGDFIPAKGMIVVGTTALVLIIYAAATLVLQTGYYLATHKKEHVYLTQSEEIYPDDNIWGVRGCYTRNCDSESSLYYRIGPSLFHHIWSLSDDGNLFLPDAIGAGVPTGSTRCEVESYGIRARVLMLFHIYPRALKMVCENTAAEGAVQDLRP